MRELLALSLCSMFMALPTGFIKEPAVSLSPVPVSLSARVTEEGPDFACVSEDLWQFLRKGLTYLESPKPLLPPESVSPSYVHPDGRGFGAYGFSPEAYEDVQRLYPFFKKYSWDQILHSQKLYDLANRALCDWMLKSLKTYVQPDADKKTVFLVIHKAWNLGMTGFKRGREVVPSRTRRAEEFLSTNG